MRRDFSGKLNDVLPQIGLDRMNPCPLQCLVQVHFFAEHTFALDDLPNPFPVGQVEDKLHSLPCVLRPDDSATLLYDLFLQPCQIVGEFGQSVCFDIPSVLPPSTKRPRACPRRARSGASRPVTMFSGRSGSR